MTAICRSYLLPCPYAMASEDAPVPCMGSQENCDAYNAKYKEDEPKMYARLQKIKKDLGDRIKTLSQNSLIEIINKEFS